MTPEMQLEVLTPDKIVLQTTTPSMQVLLPDGWWGILPGHAPLISFVNAGVIHYRTGDSKRFIAIYKGTVEVQKGAGGATRVLILTSAAEEGADLFEAQNALERQAALLAEKAKEANMEFNQLRLSLEKSLKNADISDLRL